MNRIAKQIVFRGRVQGVGFRYTTHRAANRYDLIGYVRNLPDGTVEAFMQGTEANIQTCLNEIRECFGGYIREMIVTEKPVNIQYHDFKITY